MPKQRRNTSVHARNETERALRRSAAWFAGQKEAFQVAMDGAALETSLGILIRTAIEQAKDSRRCAFFRVRPNRIELEHVVGMGDAYARRVDGFKIGPDSLSCGLAAWSGQPVIIPDVEEEPHCKPWLWLAREFDFRACWSFPTETSAGKIVGTFVMYFKAPRRPTARDRELITSLTHSASIIISHYEEVQARKEHQERQRLLVDELNHREARLQEALAAGSVMAFDWDASTGLIQRSNNAAQLLGYDPQQTFDAESFQARVHPDDLARLKAFWRSLDRDNPTSITFRFLRLDGREIWLLETSKAEFDAAGRFLRLKGLARDVTEHMRAERHQKVLMAELDHRVKNVLARVVAVANSTRQVGGSIDEFIRSFNGRIHSMATAHALLSQTRWQGTDLAAVVRSQLAPYATDVNITISGTDIVLGASATDTLATVVHELVTNAVKHGALSIPGGHVSVTWNFKPNVQAATLILEWREAGGPPVASKVQSSYGTDLIRNLIPYELGGAVDLVFAADGVRCTIEVPVEPL
jgi:PAS domain S-box-containing protein